MAERGSEEQRSTAQWRALVGSYEASGLSARAFCAQCGVAQSTFDHWRRRLREDAAGVGSAPLPGVPIGPGAGPCGAAGAEVVPAGLRWSPAGGCALR